jgi:hypothetical protein
VSAGKPFRVASKFQPAGDQPAAIAALVRAFEAGLAAQTCSASPAPARPSRWRNVVQELQRPTIVMAHNKTLAAQLYGEFREFFPDNAVEYFVSYYDYYQPEAYVPSSDTFIEKDASINDHIEQMRLSATKALLERRGTPHRRDGVGIYGLGDPEAYFKMVMHLSRGEIIDQRAMLRQLAELQYQRNDIDFSPRHLPGARRRHRHLPGGGGGGGGARRAVRRGDRGHQPLRPAHRRRSAQGAALHDLSEDPLRDFPRGHARAIEQIEVELEERVECSSRRTTSFSRPSACSSAPSTTSR